MDVKRCHPLGALPLLWLLAAGGALAAELKPVTVEAFDRYVKAAETRIEGRARARDFLWVDGSPERLKAVRTGQIAVEPVVARGDLEIPEGLVHDWIGAVFVPGATLERTLASVQDYDHHRHQAEVLDSRLLSRDGNHYRVYLRLIKKKVLTVVLSTEHDVRYFPLDAKRCQSRSYSTRIAEVTGAGTSGEREVPAGRDHGFLWRLHSYWRFQERDGGVYIECEAISLTRDVPTGLGWLIEPIIRQLPRESLVSTLRATRDGIPQTPAVREAYGGDRPRATRGLLPRAGARRAGRQKHTPRRRDPAPESLRASSPTGPLAAFDRNLRHEVERATLAAPRRSLARAAPFRSRASTPR